MRGGGVVAATTIAEKETCRTRYGIANVNMLSFGLRYNYKHTLDYFVFYCYISSLSPCTAIYIYQFRSLAHNLPYVLSFSVFLTISRHIIYFIFYRCARHECVCVCECLRRIFSYRTHILVLFLMYVCVCVRVLAIHLPFPSNVFWVL